MSLYKDLTIGNIALNGNVILAPMSGVTDMPYRRLVKSYGATLVVSEMIASQAMLRSTRQSIQKSKISLDQQPASLQLAGCDPATMAEAAKLNEDLGAAIIDINMGCPAKKIAIKSYAGSALMRDEVLAGKIIEATVKAVGVPVTLKMRMGWDHDSLNAPKLAKIAQDSGVEMITVHGRTRCQLYNGQADWEFISKVKAAVSVPVIGNGDVVCEENAKELLEKSNADGVMIGRGCYGRPWFLDQVSHYLKTGEKKAAPTYGQIRDVMLSHFEDMLGFYGTVTGIRLARKHLSWYSKSMSGSAEFRAKVNTLSDPKEVISAIKDFFAPYA